MIFFLISVQITWTLGYTLKLIICIFLQKPKYVFDLHVYVSQSRHWDFFGFTLKLISCMFVQKILNKLLVYISVYLCLSSISSHVCGLKGRQMLKTLMRMSGSLWLIARSSV